MASGKSPSPQALVTGGFAPSATITRKPFWRAAIAAASPAGPPPTTNTSVSQPMHPPLRQKLAFLRRSEGLTTVGHFNGTWRQEQLPDGPAVKARPQDTWPPWLY